MAVAFQEREALSPSSLLPDNQDTVNHQDSGSESAFSGFWSCGSSSSDLNRSELDSTETENDEDDDFIDELNRQMADFMLQEDDQTAAPNCGSDKSKENDYNLDFNHQHEQTLMGKSVNTYSVKKSNIGFQSSQTLPGDRIQPIQFYQLKNQPRVKESGSMSWGRWGTCQNGGRGHEFGNGGKVYPIGSSSQVGSGMRAIFLGGSGSGKASCGTGVFLPRGTCNAPDQGRKKPGCSTVLIPTRVLQALEQHFNNMESRSPSNGLTAHPYQHGVGNNTKQKRQLQSKVEAAMNHQETQLPQEWTY